MDCPITAISVNVDSTSDEYIISQIELSHSIFPRHLLEARAKNGMNFVLTLHRDKSSSWKSGSTHHFKMDTTSLKFTRNWTKSNCTSPEVTDILIEKGFDLAKLAKAGIIFPESYLTDSSCGDKADSSHGDNAVAEIIKLHDDVLVFRDVDGQKHDIADGRNVDFFSCIMDTAKNPEGFIVRGNIKTGTSPAKLISSELFFDSKDSALECVRLAGDTSRKFQGLRPLNATNLTGSTQADLFSFEAGYLVLQQAEQFIIVKLPICTVNYGLKYRTYADGLAVVFNVDIWFPDVKSYLFYTAERKFDNPHTAHLYMAYLSKKLIDFGNPDMFIVSEESFNKIHQQCKQMKQMDKLLNRIVF